MWLIKKGDLFFAGENKGHHPMYSTSHTDAFLFESKHLAQSVAMRYGIRSEVEIVQVQQPAISYQ